MIQRVVGLGRGTSVMRHFAAGLFAASVFHPARAQQVIDYGGQTPCSVWLSSPQASRAGLAWVYGAWSGLNMAGGLKNDVFDVGHTLKPEEVARGVEYACRQDMAKIMNSAVLEAYIKARASGS